MAYHNFERQIVIGVSRSYMQEVLIKVQDNIMRSKSSWPIKTCRTDHRVPKEFLKHKVQCRLHHDPYDLMSCDVKLLVVRLI